MKIIIPAAGVGTRLRPHTLTKPKPLLPVAGHRMIDLIMAEIIALPHVDEIIFIIGYRGDMIREYITKSYPDVPCSFVEQKEYKGLGHAVSLVEEHVHPDDDILIILSDTIFKADLASVIAKKQNALGVCHVDDPRRFGVAVMQGDRVTGLIEKPETPVSNLALVGIYYIANGPHLFDQLDHLIKNDITTKNEIQLTDALSRMLDAGEPFTVFPVTQWFDCGTKDATLDTNRTLIKHRVGKATVTDSVIIPPVVIDDDAIIERSVVGPYVYICSGAEVRSSVVSNSIIGEAVVEHAVLDGAFLDDNSVFRGRPKAPDLGMSASV
ncbi:MAG: NTP transferase domain-containing protein [Spirochaetes bacterium]|nr:NTP transferase domain-containing protein [Spirochaetota bacterium]